MKIYFIITLASVIGIFFLDIDLWLKFILTLVLCAVFFWQCCVKSYPAEYEQEERDNFLIEN